VFLLDGKIGELLRLLYGTNSIYIFLLNMGFLELTSIDPIAEDIRIKIREYQDQIYIKYGQGIIPHPDEFILGGSFEYFHFPYWVVTLWNRLIFAELRLWLSAIYRSKPKF
jgi:hypothetical protein